MDEVMDTGDQVLPQLGPSSPLLCACREMGKESEARGDCKCRAQEMERGSS